MIVFAFGECPNPEVGQLYFRQILSKAEKFVWFYQSTNLNEEKNLTDFGKYVCEHIQSTDGIVEGSISFDDPYRVQVGKTRMYSWNEILDQLRTKFNLPECNSEE